MATKSCPNAGPWVCGLVNNLELAATARITRGSAPTPQQHTMALMAGNVLRKGLGIQMEPLQPELVAAMDKTVLASLAPFVSVYIGKLNTAQGLQIDMPAIETGSVIPNRALPTQPKAIVVGRKGPAAGTRAATKQQGDLLQSVDSTLAEMSKSLQVDTALQEMSKLLGVTPESIKTATGAGIPGADRMDTPTRALPGVPTSALALPIGKKIQNICQGVNFPKPTRSFNESVLDPSYTVRDIEAYRPEEWEAAEWQRHVGRHRGKREMDPEPPWEELIPREQRKYAGKIGYEEHLGRDWTQDYKEEWSKKWDKWKKCWKIRDPQGQPWIPSGGAQCIDETSRCEDGRGDMPLVEYIPGTHGFDACRCIKMKCYQQDIARWFMNAEVEQAMDREGSLPRHGLLCVLGTGVGKTLVGINVGEMLFRHNIIKDYVIVTKNATLADEIYNDLGLCYGIRVPKTKEEKAKVLEGLSMKTWFGLKLSHIKVHSYTTFLNDDKDISNALVIIDEAHNITTRTEDGKAAKFDRILQRTRTAQYVICLTATPIKDGPYAMALLARLLHKEPLSPTYNALLPLVRSGKHGRTDDAGSRRQMTARWAQYTTDEALQAAIDQLAPLFDQRVALCLPDMYPLDKQRCTDPTEWPKYECDFVGVDTTTRKGAQSLKKLQKQPIYKLIDAVASGTTLWSTVTKEDRNAIAKFVKKIAADKVLTQDKARVVAKHIQKANGPVCVFSVGNKPTFQVIVDEIRKALPTIDILPIGRNIHKAWGTLYAQGLVARGMGTPRNSIHQKYINKLIAVANAPDFRGVVLLQKDVAEGLTLKRFRQMHIMEQQATYANIIQIVGRVVRTGTHTDLDLSQRKVNVYQYYCQDPKDTGTPPGVQLHEAGHRAWGTDQLWYSFLHKSSICLCPMKGQKSPKFEKQTREGSKGLTGAWTLNRDPDHAKFRMCEPLRREKSGEYRRPTDTVRSKKKAMPFYIKHEEQMCLKSTKGVTIEDEVKTAKPQWGTAKIHKISKQAYAKVDTAKKDKVDKKRAYLIKDGVKGAETMKQSEVDQVYGWLAEQAETPSTPKKDKVDKKRAYLIKDGVEGAETMKQSEVDQVYGWLAEQADTPARRLPAMPPAPAPAPAPAAPKRRSSRKRKKVDYRALDKELFGSTHVRFQAPVRRKRLVIQGLNCTGGACRGPNAK
jgi:hypothetical protein